MKRPGCCFSPRFQARLVCTDVCVRSDANSLVCLWTGLQLFISLPLYKHVIPVNICVRVSEWFGILTAAVRLQMGCELRQGVRDIWLWPFIESQLGLLCVWALWYPIMHFCAGREGSLTFHMNPIPQSTHGYPLQCGRIGNSILNRKISLSHTRTTNKFVCKWATFSSPVCFAEINAPSMDSLIVIFSNHKTPSCEPICVPQTGKCHLPSFYLCLFMSVFQARLSRKSITTFQF